MPAHTFKCSRCKLVKPVQTNGGTGYAVLAKTHRKVCYDCTADLDKLDMERTGAAVLYLTASTPEHYCGEVTNWPGTLRIPVLSCKGGKHNIAGSRTDVWFKDHTGARWHGVHLGNMNQIVRCRRLAKR
jgi:hypothetical protein